MYRFIIVFALLWTPVSRACDVCGGVSSSSSIGLLAANKFHTFGWRTQYRVFSSYLEGIRHSREHLLSNELTFRIQPTERLQIFGQIPYHLNQQVRDFGADLVYGMGDPQLLGNYILLHKKDSVQNTRHFLSVGVGVKFPLGKSSTYDNPLKNLFPGTGAFDLPFVSQYTFGFRGKNSLVSEASFTLRGTDKQGFHFGNVGGLNSTLVHNHNWKGYRLIYGAGLQADFFGASKQAGVDLSGRDNAGHSLGLRVNVLLLTYRWLWGIQLQRPLYQNINAGMTRQQLIANVQLNYLLTKIKQ